MRQENVESYVHFSVSAVGGFLGGYALLNHHELFGNAQTSNMIHLVMGLVGTDFSDVMLRVIDLLLYLTGFALTIFIPKYLKWNLHICSVVLNTITILLLYTMPRGVSDYLFLAPVFLSMAFQWNSFKGAEGFLSSSIFSTNNLRQFSTSFFEYLADGDQKHLKKTRFFGMTLLCFHIGVLFSYLASRIWGLNGVLFGLVFIFFSAVVICLEVRQERKDVRSPYRTARNIAGKAAGTVSGSDA